MESITIKIPEDVGKLLMGWLEDEAESHYPMPKEITENFLERMVEDSVSGQLAAPIDILGQKEPPLGWLLIQLYDVLGWPRAFDEAHKVESKRLINEALAEVTCP